LSLQRGHFSMMAENSDPRTRQPKMIEQLKADFFGQPRFRKQLLHGSF
jgi:hypothetical protein